MARTILQSLETKQTTRMEVMEKLEFTLLGYVNRNKVYADLDAKVVKISWEGIVDGKSAREVLNLASDLVAQKLCNKIILDRTNLKNFTADARRVINKEILLGKAPKLAKSVKKIAAISSANANGASLGSRITESIARLFPSMNIKRFNAHEEADHWILDS